MLEQLFMIICLLLGFMLGYLIGFRVKMITTNEIYARARKELNTEQSGKH